MNKSKRFTGTGFSMNSATQNAEEQSNVFIQQERDAGKKISEETTTIESTSQKGNLSYAMLKLTYKEG